MKRYLLDVRTFKEMFLSFLNKYETGMNEYLNIHSEDKDDLIIEMIIVVIEETLMGSCTCVEYRPEKILLDVGAPPKEVNNFLSLVKDVFLSTIYPYHKELITQEENVIYHVNLHLNHSIIIGKEVVQKITTDVFDTLKDKILKEIEDGHYYPEKTRRLVGL